MDKTKLAYDIMKGSNGNWLTVEFIKKNLEHRTLNGRTGVTQGVKGNGKAWLYPIVCVWDKDIREHRAVDARRVLRITSQKTGIMFNRTMEDILESIEKPATK